MELVMCDSDPVRLEKMKSRYPDVSYTSDCQDLFNDSSIDVLQANRTALLALNSVVDPSEMASNFTFYLV